MKSAVVLCLLATVLPSLRVEARTPGLAPGDDQAPVTCPGGKATCDAGSTCCTMPAASDDATPACCPLKNAVCCADGVHCCPAGTTCNAERASCDTLPTNVTVRPAVRKQQPSTTSPTPDPVALFHGAGVQCPDRVSQCPNAGAACCRMSGSSRFSCCNYPTNVCCDDGYHCCNAGTVCDQTRLVCIHYPSSAVESRPWTPLTASSSSLDAAAAAAAVEAVRIESEAAGSLTKKSEYVVCPDGGMCADLNTCCLLRTGRYGCCPYYLATCCQDRVHCCPYGKHCTDTGLCVGSDDVQLPWAALTGKP